MSAEGKCPVCGRMIALRQDGRIRHHGSKDLYVWPPRNCPGWGRPPVAAAVPGTDQ